MEGHEYRVFLIGRGIQGARLVDALLKMLGAMWTLPQQRQQESGSPRSQSCTSIDGAGEPIPKPEVILFSTSVLSGASCASEPPNVGLSCSISKRGACSICWTINAGDLVF